MKLEEFEKERRYQRITTALEEAEKGLHDVFYALQEASTEVERNQMRIQLERLRNSTRTTYQRIPKIREAVDDDYSRN